MADQKPWEKYAGTVEQTEPVQDNRKPWEKYADTTGGEPEPVKKKESGIPRAPSPKPTEGPLASDSRYGNASFVDAKVLQESSRKGIPTVEEKEGVKEYLNDLDAARRAETEKVRNPAVSAAKSLWKTIGYQMPAGAAGTSAAIAPGLYQAALAEQGGAL